MGVVWIIRDRHKPLIALRTRMICSQKTLSRCGIAPGNVYFNREWCGLCRTLVKRGGRHDATVKQFCDFTITHPNNIA